jgi:hypothetical protein
MAINPMMLPQIIGMARQQPQMQQPMAPQMQAPQVQAPPQPQGPDSLAQMTRLLSGDLSGSLTSGDKLLALSGLLRSATRSGRRAGITPQQVIGQLQQQKVAEVQNRLQVEQLRMAEAQRRQQLEMVSQYAGALEDPQQRTALMALGPEEAAKKISEIAFRPRQVQQIVTDDQGQTKLVFGDGTTGNLDFKLERGAKWIKADPTGSGTEVLLKVDEKTGNPVLDKDGKMQTMAAGTSWADQQRIAISQANLNLSRARGSGGGGGGGDGGGASGDGKVRTIVYTMPGRSAPQVGRGYVLPGGFVRPVDGPLAGRVVPQAKSSSSGGDAAALVAAALAARQ